jgi:hypothetical protein
MYATANSIDDFLHDSQRPASVVISGRQFYNALKNGVNSFVATSFLFLSVPLAWGFVYYFRVRLQKRIPNKINLTTENYAQVRVSYDKLCQLLDGLENVQKVNLSTTPFWLRGFFREIQRLATVLCEAINSVKSDLDAMNDNFPKSKLNVFEPVSDEELWNNRPKVYKYRL